MPITQLHIVKKIKFLVSGAWITKKQIVRVVEKNAQEHRLINDRQETEDNVRVDHAVKELEEENKSASKVYSHIYTALIISTVIILILLATLALILYF